MRIVFPEQYTALPKLTFKQNECILGSDTDPEFKLMAKPEKKKKKVEI